MPTTIEPVNLLEGALALGFSATKAFQRALGMELSVWGRGHGFTPQEMWMCVNFYQGRVYDEIRAALAESLQTSIEKVGEIIERTARQKVPA